ncbi:zonular occludens toxin domain-containing protein [Variovorax sp. EBFNA2]|uniref:zonular occludens toxin domain-containing protein n=1 Tax=Variovorax sp. EBFNA2 TaxID=3342097 RepID=UPI0029C01E54|nr:zonular occludens toxin domain-containing protein [Variovorax boronicumulans]WPG38741.1 zonular occludens toxin domain-containing protein [Variovorax boronicumulans]
MINGLEGIPGSGKSFEASVYQVLDALKRGRKVITNLPLVLEAYAAIDSSYGDLLELRYTPAPVRGTWDAERVDPATGQGQAFELFADGRVEKAPEGTRLFGHVWDYWSDWKHPKTGQGPLFVIDEAHVAMPRIGTSKEVVEYYKLHRHFNADILLCTQRFRAMCQDIAEIMAMVIKVRKADILGRPDSYIRKVYSGYRGAIVQTSERKYQPEFFCLYKSHTQGGSALEAGVSDVKPFLTKWRRMSWALYVVIAVVTVWAWWPARDMDKRAKLHDGRSVADIAVPKGTPFLPCVDGAVWKNDECVKAPVDGPKAAIDSVKPAMDVHSDAGGVEPLKGKSLHLTGRMHMRGKTIYTLAISEGGRRFLDTTSEELERAGYKLEALGACMGRLSYGSKVYPVSCDAPQLAVGTERAPVVVAVPGVQPGQVVASGVSPVGAQVTSIEGGGFRDPLRGGGSVNGAR